MTTDLSDPWSEGRLGTTAGLSPARRHAVLETLRETLAYARARDYRGWDYCDGMSSRVRRALPVESRTVNLLFQEAIKRAPVNLRPWLLVERRRSFMGAGLFARANLAADRLAGSTAGALGDVDYAAEAVDLLDWLIEHRCPGYSGFCGSHSHEIQHFDHVSRTTDPSVVSTVIPAAGLLEGSRLDAPRSRAYEDAARSAVRFVVDDLDYREVDRGARIDYSTGASGDHYTINGGALAARFFVDLYEHTGEDRHRERAAAILDHVASLQTDRGGWYYRCPASASHLSMDNFHNGFVIEAFLRFGEVIDRERYAATIAEALRFYRAELFGPDGAPRHDESTTYPQDIHDVAQGIIVFTMAGNAPFAARIFEWAREHLYAGDGRFLYQRRRLYTKRFTLMRWCQAWMARALAVFAERTGNT